MTGTVMLVGPVLVAIDMQTKSGRYAAVKRAGLPADIKDGDKVQFTKADVEFRTASATMPASAALFHQRETDE